MRESWLRLEVWLKAHAPEVHNSLNAPVSPGRLVALAANLRTPIPQDLQEAWAVHDGQAPDAPGLVNAATLLSVQGMQAQWAIWKALWDAGQFAGSNAEARGPVRPEWWNPRWLPFTHDGAGNHLCLDLDPALGGRPGQVIQVWHDSPERIVIAPSFADWFSGFAVDVEAGAYRYDLDLGGLVKV